MALLPIFWRAKGSFNGAQLECSSVNLGTVGGVTIGNNTTTSINIPKPAGVVSQLVSVELVALVAGVPNTGDILAQLFKRDNSGTPANRTLTGTKSLTATVVTTTDKTYPFAITATSAANLTFQSTDTLRVDVVTTDTVNTQPKCTLVATFALLRPY